MTETDDNHMSSSIKSITGNGFRYVVGENCTSIGTASFQNGIGQYYRHYYVNGNWIKGTTHRKMIFTCRVGEASVTHWTNEEYVEHCRIGYQEYLDYIKTLYENGGTI